MEYTNKIKRETIQLLMVIGIYICIALLLTSIIVLVKNVKEIKSDPISYGVEQKGFNMCTCYDYNEKSYDYNATGSIIRIRSNPIKIEESDLEKLREFFQE